MALRATDEENTQRPPEARPPRRESALRGRGSSNSRSGPSSDRNPGRPKLPPPSSREWRAVLEAHHAGRISAVEAEVLVGYLFLAPRGVLSERTDRRRRDRLRELGIAPRSGVDLAAWELANRVEAGQLSYEEAESILGRYVLEDLRP